MTTFEDANDELKRTGRLDPEFEDVIFEETGLGESLSAHWKSIRNAGIATGGDWLDKSPPDREYLLSLKGKLTGWKVTGPRGMLPQGRVGMLAAAGGAGKSMALAELGVSVATGRPWFEAYEVNTPGHVLLVMGEEEEVEMQRRIYYVCKGLNLTEQEKELVRDRVTFLALSGVPVCLTQETERHNRKPSDFGEARETQFAVALRARLDNADHPWSLIVFDPLSRFAGPDVEIDNAAATRFVQVLERFTQVQSNPTVIVAHHTSKASRQGQTDAGAARGATALTDGVRWQANLDALPRPEGDDDSPACLTFRVTKSNYAAFPEPLTLVRDPDAHGVLRAATESERQRHQKGLEEALVEQGVKRRETTAKVRERLAAKNDDGEGPVVASPVPEVPRTMVNPPTRFEPAPPEQESEGEKTL